MMEKLKLDGIAISYGQDCILQDLSLSVQEGEFVAIVGASGCGKSTLLSILAGILPQQRGEIVVDGQKITGVSPHFTLMPQDDLLLPWMTVLENICLYGKIHGNVLDYRQKALALLPVFGLQGYEKHYPDALSGGMRQRAAFLRTALCPSDILLLDEPFAALDVITRQEMQDWLLSLRRDLGRTVLLVTHDIDEAIYLSDRVLVLGGRPAQMQASFAIEEPELSREWLLDCARLKKDIYHVLKGS